MAALVYANLVLPGLALALAGTDVCITVTDQSRHQTYVKTKLARKIERICFYLDTFLNPVIHTVRGKK